MQQRHMKDQHGYRLNNFTVALTNNKPYPMSSFPENYTLCGQWPGVAPDGATMFVGCASNLPPFRYVAIIANTTFLNMCEVEVYGIQGVIWLSGHRQSNNDLNSTFIWNPTSNISIPMSYSNWYNNTNSSPVEDWNCLAIDATTGYWSNTQCNSTNVYTLCEMT